MMKKSPSRQPAAIQLSSIQEEETPKLDDVHESKYRQFTAPIEIRL